MSVLTEVVYPDGWASVRLGSIAPRVSEAGFGHLEPLSVFLGDGVVPRSDREDNHNQLGSDLEKYQRVLPGDLVFNKLRTWQGGFGVSAYAGIVSPAYIIARPMASVFPRYLHHFMRSDPVLAELARLSKWMPPSQFDTSWEDIRGVPVVLPPLEEQRRIADFLDDQVARIDSVVEARGAQQQELALMVQRECDAAIAADGESGRIRAARFLSVLPGFAFSSERYSLNESDVRLLRGVNVGVGKLRWDDTVYWPTEELADVNAFQMQIGDIVMGMDRPWIGDGLRIARVRDDDLPCLLLQRVAKLRLAATVHPEFIMWAYRSTAFRESTEGNLTGLSVPHLSGEQILNHRLPALRLSDQIAIAQRLDQVEEQVARLSQDLEVSIGLLDEYKRSLIAAAVTGEFDVTTARAGVTA